LPSKWWQTLQTSCHIRGSFVTFSCGFEELEENNICVKIGDEIKVAVTSSSFSSQITSTQSNEQSGFESNFRTTVQPISPPISEPPSPPQSLPPSPKLSCILSGDADISDSEVDSSETKILSDVIGHRQFRSDFDEINLDITNGGTPLLSNTRLIQRDEIALGSFDAAIRSNKSDERGSPTNSSHYLNENEACDLRLRMRNVTPSKLLNHPIKSIRSIAKVGTKSLQRLIVKSDQNNILTWNEKNGLGYSKVN